MIKTKTSYAVALMFELNKITFITSVDNANRTFEYEAGQKAYLFSSKKVADDLALCCCINGYNAMVVSVKRWNVGLENK